MENTMLCWVQTFFGVITNPACSNFHKFYIQHARIAAIALMPTAFKEFVFPLKVLIIIILVSFSTKLSSFRVLCELQRLFKKIEI